MPQTYTYYGDPAKRPKGAHPDSPQTPEPYVADEDIIRAVNLAIYLRRPLLLEGEAGCGKTRLAQAVAYELGLPFYRWDVRSTSQARDGLYTYDAVLRLHDVQTTRAGKLKGPRDPNDATAYRRFGALGEAFSQPDCPAVVLIDEIDKADIDFPNDLLAVLDEPWEFTIPETGEKPIKAKHIPIVIVTSNKEKGNLPAPFLRRCLYHYIEFPDPERLRQIVDAHYQERPSAEQPSAELSVEAAQQFLALRQEGLFKKPGTSEFLDWLETLHNFKLDHIKLPALTKENTLPFPEILFKLQRDWKLMRDRSRMAAG